MKQIIDRKQRLKGICKSGWPQYWILVFAMYSLICHISFTEENNRTCRFRLQTCMQLYHSSANELKSWNWATVSELGQSHEFCIATKLSDDTLANRYMFYSYLLAIIGLITNQNNFNPSSFQRLKWNIILFLFHILANLVNIIVQYYQIN